MNSKSEKLSKIRENKSKKSFGKTRLDQENFVFPIKIDKEIKINKRLFRIVLSILAVAIIRAYYINITSANELSQLALTISTATLALGIIFSK